MTIVIESIGDSTPKYFPTKEVAFLHHYTEGGFLWKRRDGISKLCKPFASGIIPATRLDTYELFMIDGRNPTAEDIKKAKQACCDARDSITDIILNNPSIECIELQE